jgi:hypothetical protein
LIASLFDRNQVKGLLLDHWQALESEDELTKTSLVFLAGTDTNLGHLIEIVVLAPIAHTGNEVVDHDPVHPGREIGARLE